MAFRKYIYVMYWKWMRSQRPVHKESLVHICGLQYEFLFPSLALYVFLYLLFLIFFVKIIFFLLSIYFL